jgi:hypothetical protein
MAAFTYGTVHEELRLAVPEFGPAVDEHVAEYDEVLQHVLFGDLTRFVLAAHERGDREVEERCLGFLDRAVRDGDDEVKNLVLVSFVENIQPWDPSRADFIGSWPSALRGAAVRAQRAQDDSTG